MNAARWISVVAHPFVTTAVMVVAIAMKFGGAIEAARGLSMVALFAVLPVAALMVFKVRRGTWQNVDASNVTERPILFAVSLVGLLLLLGYLAVQRPGSFLVRGTAGVLAMVGLCALATRWVKVSLHMAFAAFAATTLLLVQSPVGWVILAAIPLLAWSRLELERHRPSELALGLIIGAAAGLAVQFA